MPARIGSAVWEGTLKEGKGTMKLGSGAYEGPYSFQSRFESGSGTNPEELIGAAEAGCFSMALSAGLGKAGHNPTSVKTSANVHAKSLRRKVSGSDRSEKSLLLRIVSNKLFRETQSSFSRAFLLGRKVKDRVFHTCNTFSFVLELLQVLTVR